MIRELWQNYTVPIAVSLGGLVLAGILGVAPLFERDSPARNRQAPEITTTVSASPAADLDMSAAEALQAAVNGQGQSIDSLSNRIRTLEKGISRINVKVSGASSGSSDQSDLVARLAFLEGQMRILNKAVPRINQRLVDQGDVPAILGDLQAQVNTLEGQMRILNAAVPRLQERIVKLRDAVGQ